jgi:flagellar hook-length control protein FliK
VQGDQTPAPAAPQDFLNMPPAFRGILPSDYKSPLAASSDAGSPGNSISSQITAALNQQQTQASGQTQQDVTAKITGFSFNPALINDLANGNNGGFGTGGGFGNSQNGGAQQADPNAAALMPATADMQNNQNFINYLNTASGSAAPSPTTQLVNIQLQRNINAGINSMTLQLEPADLGRMNVKLSFTKDGTVKAHMTVDKPETLALLQRDASHLQRALQQSGLTTDENSLSFDLSQQSPQQNLQGFSGGNSGNTNNTAPAIDDEMDAGNALNAQIALQSMGYITRSGVNIMV